MGIQFGTVTESTDTGGGRGIGIWLAILALAILGGVLVVMYSQPARIVYTAAHVQPAPSASPITLNVTGKSGPVCIMPTGKPVHAAEVVKIP